MAGTSYTVTKVCAEPPVAQLIEWPGLFVLHVVGVGENVLRVAVVVVVAVVALASDVVVVGVLVAVTVFFVVVFNDFLTLAVIENVVICRFQKSCSCITI